MSLITRLKCNWGAVVVSAVANCSAMLFGLDTGIAGAVLGLRSFTNDFALAASPAKMASSSSNIVALLNAGCFFGALAPSLLSKKVGRPRMLTLASIFLLLGGILQTCALAPSLSMIYAGRVISGFGVGMISNLIPVYVAECSPKDLRGFLMGLFELYLVLGSLLAYWAAYGVGKHMASTHWQWRLLLSIQIMLSVIVLVGSLFIVESPRWLARQGLWDEAEQSLCFLRGDTSLEIQTEMAEIRVQLQQERALTQHRKIKELFQRSNFIRILCSMGMGFFLIWTGQNALLYYGPVVFKTIGYTSQNAALMASGIFTIIKLATTILFLVAGVEIFRRKTILVIGASLMGILLFGLGAMLRLKKIDDSESKHSMMAVIYLFVAVYSLSWGPVAWIYIGEIFPTRIRDYGVTAGTMTIWLMNYVVSKFTPIALQNIGWKTWMIFGTTNIVAAIFACAVPETKDVGLEDMDMVFGVVELEGRKLEVERVLKLNERSMPGEGSEVV